MAELPRAVYRPVSGLAATCRLRSTVSDQGRSASIREGKTMKAEVISMQQWKAAHPPALMPLPALQAYF